MTRERTAHARREHAATLRGAPLVKGLRVVAERDAGRRCVVANLPGLRPRDVGRIADVADRPVRMSREQSSDAVQRRLGLRVTRRDREARAKRLALDAIERIEQRSEVLR